MKADIIKVHPVNPQQRLLEKAAQLICNDGVIVYPSDTSYALAANAFSKKAVERLIDFKKGDKSTLFSCICYDFSKISELAFVGNSHFGIMKKLLPGPYTFILKGRHLLPKITLSKRKSIGVRMPAFPITEALYRLCGQPFFTCSIRQPGTDEVLNDPHEIQGKMGHLVDLIIDAGPVNYSPSSVVSFEEDIPEIIREGSGDLSLFNS